MYLEDRTIRLQLWDTAGQVIIINKRWNIYKKYLDKK